MESGVGSFVVSKDEIFNFEKLNVYQKSLAFLDLVYKTSDTFPKMENFALTNQFIRAAQSISLNIAEGSGNTVPLFIRYLNIAKSSVRECIVCVSIAKRRKYINEEIEIILRNQLILISKMISGLITSLKK
ncbi:MAG: four helix bundle protein [Bacteroidales bacterium]|jgi:four helix bundle protein